VQNEKKKASRRGSPVGFEEERAFFSLVDFHAEQSMCQDISGIAAAH
jgi:hypothetical protein